MPSLCRHYSRWTKRSNPTGAYQVNPQAPNFNVAQSSTVHVRYVITMTSPSLCHHYVITITICHHYVITITMSALCHHYVITITMSCLCHHHHYVITVTISSLCHAYVITITMSSLCHHHHYMPSLCHH